MRDKTKRTDSCKRALWAIKYPIICHLEDYVDVYKRQETSSVKGFYIANNIEFEIDQKGNVYVYEDGNKVLAKDHLTVMKNDLVKGRLEWNKTGEIFTHTDTGQNEFGKVETPVWEQSNFCLLYTSRCV